MNPREVAGRLLGRLPNPGSDEAIKQGCTCPREGNARGAGCGWIGDNGDPCFWVMEDCPLHGRKNERPIISNSPE